jgi:hypothetical protein
MIKSIQTNKMKNILLLTLVITTIFSCTETVPEDLKGKKQYVAKKKAEIREIQKEIDLVNKDIMKLDPPKEKQAVAVKSLSLMYSKDTLSSKQESYQKMLPMYHQI